MAADSSDVMIRVLLVDDHPLVRTGLRALLESAGDIAVTGEAADGAEAVSVLTEADPDVVLMDLSMPGVDGVTATQRVIAQRPQVQVIVLTSSAERERVRAALDAGATGYLLKDSTPEDLRAAVRSAAQGHSPLDPRIAGALLPSARSGEPRLSDRELEVLRLVSRGLANKQIARALGIAERTVKVHLGNIFRRIGVSDRTSAALWAREHLPTG
jgi:DNA-binding NarL/FixJ family response regulator